MDVVEVVAVVEVLNLRQHGVERADDDAVHRGGKVTRYARVSAAPVGQPLDVHAPSGGIGGGAEVAEVGSQQHGRGGAHEGDEDAQAVRNAGIEAHDLELLQLQQQEARELRDAADAALAALTVAGGVAEHLVQDVQRGQAAQRARKVRINHRLVAIVGHHVAAHVDEELTKHVQRILGLRAQLLWRSSVREQRR